MFLPNSSISMPTLYRVLLRQNPRLFDCSQHSPASRCVQVMSLCPGLWMDCACYRDLNGLHLATAYFKASPQIPPSPWIRAHLFPVRIERLSISIYDLFVTWVSVKLFWNEASIMNMSQRFSPGHPIPSHSLPDKQSDRSHINQKRISSATGLYPLPTRVCLSSLGDQTGAPLARCLLDYLSVSVVSVNHLSL